VWLKVVTFVPWQRIDVGVRNDYLLAAQSKAKNLSAECARKKANKGRFSKIPGRALLHNFCLVVRKGNFHLSDCFVVGNANFLQVDYPVTGPHDALLDYFRIANHPEVNCVSFMGEAIEVQLRHRVCLSRPVSRIVTTEPGLHVHVGQHFFHSTRPLQISGNARPIKV
jgi:hypothetical protein